MKLFLIIFLSIIFISNCFSQVSEEWVRKVNGSNSGTDAGNSIIADPSGNIIVTGYVNNAGTWKDIYTVKYSPTGNVIWSATYNSQYNFNDVGMFAACDASGNIYVTGTSDSVYTEDDFITIKYSSSGVLQWSIRYNGGGFGNASDIPCGILIDNSSNVYISGTSIGRGTSNDIAILKYNTNGAQQWLVRFDSTDDQAYGMAMDPSSNIVICGTSNLHNQDYIVLKYNSSGIREWVRNYTTPGNFEDIPSTITTDNAGNIITTGYTNLNQDYLTVKYSPSGNLVWAVNYNGIASATDAAATVLTDNTGNVYVTGSSSGINSSRDIVTLKYTNAGNIIWERRFNGLGNNYDSPSSLKLNSQGDIIICGRTIGYSLFNDFVTLKYDSAGVFKWNRYFDGTLNTNDIPNSVALINNSGDVYVSGYSTDNATGINFCTVKYSAGIAHDIRMGPFINVPAVLYTNNNYSIKTRVYSNSSVNDTIVPVSFYINSTLVNSSNIFLYSGEDDTLNYLWTPTVPGTYELKYVSSLSNDIDRANDTVKMNVQVINSPVNFSTIRVCRNNLNIHILNNTSAKDSIIINIPNAISILDINVKIDTVLHTWVSDLRFELTHLSITDTLILHRGSSGDNFIGTNLNDSASIPISSGTAPFTGSFRPDKPLNKFNSQNPNGNWVLRIYSDAGADTGMLKAWCLEIQYDYVTGITNTGNIPQQFSLSQNYPNPFNPSTIIKFGIPETGIVKLKVFDVLGREIAVLVNEEMKPGNYEAAFTGEDLPSGVYFYSLVTPQFTDVKKMVLIK